MREKDLNDCYDTDTTQDTIIKICSNCYQQYEIYDDTLMCPYCGYVESESSDNDLTDESSETSEIEICPNCGEEYEVFDDSPICPFCGYTYSAIFEENDNNSHDAEAPDVQLTTSEQEIDEPIVCCPKCGNEYEAFDDSPICPFCGAGLEEQLDDENEDEATDEIITESVDEVVFNETDDEEYEENDDDEYDEDEIITVNVGEQQSEADCLSAESPMESAIESRTSEDEVSVDIPPDEDISENVDSEIPSTFLTCHHCGQEFELFDDDPICPHCGTIYDSDNQSSEDLPVENTSDCSTEKIDQSDAEQALEKLLNSNAPEDDSFDRCLGCMQKIKPGTKYCKHCGYEQSQPPLENYHLIPGTILDDRYVVGRVLGFGGFGITYIGWDTKLLRRIAIKEYMPTEFATRVLGENELTVFSGEKAEQFEIGKSKFMDEGQMLAGCNNVPGVVKIYDVLSENGTSYLTMELLEGESLKERLDREKSLPVEDAIAIIVPILDALEGVHNYGLIHRDVSPDNIFLCKNGDVKLIDFGAARYATTNFSRSLSVILKPGYAPEEQYRSRGEQGPWTDVYAAGATLYKMITGVTPPDAMERVSDDQLRSAVGVPSWVAAADKKYKHFKYTLANFFYRVLSDKNKEKTETVDINFTQKESRSERRERFALHTYQRLTGTTPDTVNYSEESYAADDKIKSIPEHVYIAMMNAMNVDKDDRTQSAKQFRDELTEKVKAKWLIVKNRKLDIGAFPRWMKAAGAVAAAVVVVLVVSLSSIIVGAASTEIYTPEIINMMTDEAEQKILDSELEYMIVDSQISEKVPENKVMLQAPYAGTMIEKGSVVKATISMGTEKVTVPNFVGMTKAEAEQELSKLHLTAEYSEDYSSVEKGKICQQDKEANSRVSVDSVLKLTISLGLEDVDNDENVSVPEITGLTLEEAKSKLESVNLYLDVESEKYDDKPAGTVISQSVKTGSTVKQGTTIKVVVSKGKETVIVPYVTYKTESEAISLLEKANLKYGIKYEYHESVAKGNVISQSIAAEKSVAPGTTIDLVVSKGKKTVTVPNVVGNKSATAVKSIEEKGLKVTVKEENNDSVEAGKVIRQSPAAKKEVDNGSTVTIYVSKGKNSVTIPSVKGKSSADAKSTLEDKGFNVKITEQYSDTVEKGKVISQSPSANSSLTKSSTVTIYVSKGIQPVTVPNVVGKSSSAASSSLSKVGLKVKTQEEYSTSVAKGNVIKQSPSANASVYKGDTITITVSKGKEPTTVPDVVGKTSASAQSAITSADLNVKVVEAYSDSVASGTVIKQSPSGNSSAGKGDTVTITVSKGKEPLKVPNVVGKSSSSAQNTITSMGLKISVVQEYSSTVASGNVIKQSPAANTSVYKGDTITITVSKGKEPTTVPDVLGKTKTNAQSAITAAGLKVKVVEEYSETDASGTVIGQSPADGDSAYKGDTVTITVSKGKKPITVPNVVGKTSSNAQSSITSAGFKVKVVEGYSDSVSSGYVIKQSPSGNTSAYKNDTITITVSKGKSNWSDWVTSLPSGVSTSNGYEIDTRTEYRSRSISSERVVGDWSGWSGWSTDRQSTNDNKQEDSKQQYRYYRFVCPNCGDDWYGYTTCFSCGRAKYVYGSSDWGSGIVEGVHYMWYDLPKDSISWSKATSDSTAIRAKLGTNVYWYYLNTIPGDYYWSRTVYRYRTRDVSSRTVYGSWSSWTTDKITSSSSLDVETRKVYKYRVKPVS